MLAPRLFQNRAYVMGVGASAMSALNIFLCIFALPLLFQLVRGADASMSGLLVVPFLLSTVAGNLIVAWLAPRMGRMRGILSGGYVAATIGLVALAAATPAVPTVLVLLAMTLAGIGLGMTMVGTLIGVQNALERRDMGSGTGALLVIRSLGSALGGALAGTLLALEFRHALAQTGVKETLDLGALRHGSEAMAHLSPVVRQALAGGVESGFHLIFAAGAVAATIALIIVRRMPDLELRSSVTEHAKSALMD